MNVPFNLHHQRRHSSLLLATACFGALMPLALASAVAQATEALSFDLDPAIASPTPTREPEKQPPEKQPPEKQPPEKQSSVDQPSPAPSPGMHRSQPAISLNFDPPSMVAVRTTDQAPWSQAPWRQALTWPWERSPFHGGNQSLVARVVGHAEGTRSVTGEPTWAYWGHRDPGNQAWNRGTFSYQHAARSPEDADAKQLQRLQQQTKLLEQQAKAKGLQLSLTETLNGIDLANQAPLAALDRGYIDWLAEAKQLHLSESEAILWARTWSYWDPDLNRWNAPGLGNQRSSIEADQQRRQGAIAQVLEHLQQHCSPKSPQDSLQDNAHACPPGALP